jgi:hypothetical protein
MIYFQKVVGANLGVNVAKHKSIGKKVCSTGFFRTAMYLVRARGMTASEERQAVYNQNA